jgi:hypothetical protein
MKYFQLYGYLCFLYKRKKRIFRANYDFLKKDKKLLEKDKKV